MSYNKLINAVIALVEDRPADAREMLRSPELKVSASEVQQRLFTALRERETAARVDSLKDVLLTSLRIDADTIERDDPKHREAFLRGVTAVEKIVENLLDELGA